MDIEITKLNGTTYRLSDFKIQVSDVIVERIEMNDKYQDFEGIHGRHLINSVYHKRKIMVPVFFIAEDNVDYTIQRNLLYELVQDTQPFWIRELRKFNKNSYQFKNTLAEDYQEVDDYQNPIVEDIVDEYVSAKRYLVKLTNVLNPKQKHFKCNVELEFETTKLPFAESVSTSLNLNKQLLNTEWSSDMDIDLNVKNKQTYIFENVKVGEVYYHGSIPNNQFNMYNKVKIVIGKPTTEFSWSLSKGSVMTIKDIKLVPGDVIQYNGTEITKNGLSIVRYTNIEMPEFYPGYNKFSLNQSVKRIEFDMRFYSK
nr:MAG TPA: distal tail protein [Caudoviricetes sp.]